MRSSTRYEGSLTRTTRARSVCTLTVRCGDPSGKASTGTTTVIVDH